MARTGGAPQPTITPDSALGGMVIERSLRFNDDDSAYLSRTPGSAGNRKTFTISAWVKLSSLESTVRPIFTRYTANSEAGFLGLYVNSDNYIYFTGWSTVYLKSSRLYRDSTGWSHIVCAVDTTQGTASDRVKLYFNGELQTLATYNAPSQDADLVINEASAEHRIGNYNPSGGNYFDGYMAEMNFIDGQQLDSSYFGYTEFQTGIWRPKRYEGTYGTNGFYLDFSDNSSTTTLGIDKSPNGNDWSLNNFSVSAGIDNDSFTDTPTSENVFAQLNSALPLASGASYRNGNYAFHMTNNGAHMRASSNMPVNSGKWYAEFKLSSYTFASGSYPYIGVCAEDRWINSWTGDAGTAYQTGGTIWRNGSAIESGHATYTQGDIISVAINLDSSPPQVWWAKNGTYIRDASANPATGAYGVNIEPASYTGYYNFAISLWAATGGQWDANFGQRAFSYDIPSGFKTLCTDNVRSTQSIIPKQHFDTLLYTGNDSSDRNIEGLEFKPDMVWIKNRSQTDWHHLVDSVRGANKAIFVNTTDGEDTDNSNGHVNYFTSGGFNVDAGAQGNTNENNENYVAWCWKAGGAAVSNSDGTITSSISVNQEAGFSIVSYTGNGTAGATVGHGLGKKPAWIILKKRVGADNVYVYHQLMNQGSNPEQYYSELNFHAGATDSNKIHNDTAPTTSVFSLSNDNASNQNSSTYIAYCWAEIPGYSKFGYYQANGIDTNGPYVHLGFRPAWVMIKSMSLSNSDWTIFDNKRNTSNKVNNHLAANQNHAEAADNYEIVDFLSDGFKITGLSGSAINYNTSYPQLIYMAFAEQSPSTALPQANPNAR